MIQGVCWLRPSGENACGEKNARTSAAMSGVSCPVCRTIIELELELLVTIPTFSVADPHRFLK
jgi:MinD superfamily P-loop ATPase